MLEIAGWNTPHELNHAADVECWLQNGSHALRSPIIRVKRTPIIPSGPNAPMAKRNLRFVPAVVDGPAIAVQLIRVCVEFASMTSCGLNGNNGTLAMLGPYVRKDPCIQAESQDTRRTSWHPKAGLALRGSAKAGLRATLYFSRHKRSH